MPFDYLPASRRHNLQLYKYSGADHSFISRHVLTPYWNWLVSLFPLWVAPNTITLSGLALVGLNFATLLIVDPALQCGTDAKLDSAIYAAHNQGAVLAPRPIFGRFGFPSSVHPSEESRSLFGYLFGNASDPAQGAPSCLPNWVYYTWALCLFAYQSLDSIDGKQARRTGMAGPLGELFDHGCDAINTTLECILCASALNLGRSYWTVASLVATLSNFYLTTWEEYHTGTLFLSAFSGPVEGILMICAIYVITGLAGGPSFWDRGILTVTGLEHVDWIAKGYAWLNVPLNDAFMTFGALGLAANVLASYGNVIRARHSRKESGGTPIFGLVPLLLQVIANVAWLSAKDARLIADGYAFVPFLCYWGLGFAYNVGLLIVAHVSKAPFPYWNVAVVWSALGAIDAWLPTPIIQRTPAITRQFVYLSLFLAILLYAHFVYVVITTITREIGVPCFVVRPRKFASGSVEPGAGAGGREAQRRTEDMAEAVRIEREKAALGGKFAKGQ